MLPYANSFLVNSLTVTSPCVIYMLRDMDIMEDLYDIRKVSEEMCILCSRVIVHVCIRLYIKGQAIQDVQRKSEWISTYI